MTRLTIGLAAAATLTGLSALPAHALVVQGTQELDGSGLGAVSTVLTLQSPGRSSDESGAVSFGDGQGLITGDAKTGASQTTLRSIADVGVSSAADLRIVFNAAEPGNAAARSIQLLDLTLSIYSPTGQLLYQSAGFSPVSFADTFAGTGKAGVVFSLDAAEAAQAQAAAFGAGFGGNLIGLSATAADATGGVETFAVASSAALVPEPESYLLGLAGLAAMAGWFRLRRRPA